MASKFVKKCQNCGAEMNGYSTKCTNCGTEIQLKRNWFVTFWLWLGIIGSTLGIIINVDILINLRKMSEGMPEFTLTQLAIVVCSCLCLMGYIMLLLWKRAGFYTIVGANLTSLGLTIMMIGTFPIASFVGFIIGTLLLFGILNIRRNGISYWDAMELRKK